MPMPMLTWVPLICRLILLHCLDGAMGKNCFLSGFVFREVARLAGTDGPAEFRKFNAAIGRYFHMPVFYLTCVKLLTKSTRASMVHSWGERPASVSP